MSFISKLRPRPTVKTAGLLWPGEPPCAPTREEAEAFIRAQGASVLDIGSNAGFFSLQAKLLGAGRVLGLVASKHSHSRLDLTAVH